jgi:large subunit ribosomal protein L15
MKLSQLLKVKTRSKKKVGRGIGSGRGKTSGRGTKGQKARGKIPPGFIGGLSFYKKLPLRRGLGNPSMSKKPKTISLSLLNRFPARSIIDLDLLIKEKIITNKEAREGVKILGGEISKSLTIKLPVSGNVKKIIEGLGGKIIDV